MGKLENALKTFNLDANFTHEQLEKAYSLKSKIMYVDFGNKKEDTIRRENESYQMFINNIMYGNNEKDHHETINGESLVQIVSMKELIITVYTILIDRDYMLNNIKTKVEEQFKPGSAEYNLGAKYYIRMKLAKTYEEAKGIYNDALVQLSSLDTIEENKKTSSR